MPYGLEVRVLSSALMINLAVTTRECNPGDDFILNGIKNLYPEDVSWAIYNRNPDNKLVCGNQWTGHSLDIFDQVIIAGSPQWYGKAVQRLYESLIETPRSISFYGIGVGESGKLNLSDLDLAILKQANSIITRGEECKKQLQECGIQSVTRECPALFAGKPEVTDEDRVCGVLTTKRPNKTNDTISVQKQVELYKQLNANEVIVHHLDEVEEAKRYFEKVWYTYNPDDYTRIYKQFDVIVSSRLHGAIFAMAWGRPAFLIDTGSKRCQDAAPQVPLMEFCGADQVKDKLNQLNIKEKSSEIVEFISQKKKEYQEVISNNDANA